jgi:hypothetical protein
MKTFIANTDVPAGKMDVQAWITGVPKMLSAAKVEGVKLKAAYCCTPEKKIICEFEGPDINSVKNALEKIRLPVSAITEVKVVKLEPYPEDASNMPPYHSHLT